MFYFMLLFRCCVCPKTHYLSQCFAISLYLQSFFSISNIFHDISKIMKDYVYFEGLFRIGLVYVNNSL